MSEMLEVVLVTAIAAAALLVLMRSYLPGRQKPSKAAGCPNCGSNAAARDHRTAVRPPGPRAVR